MLRIIMAGIHKGQPKTGVQFGPEKIMQHFPFKGQIKEPLKADDNLEKQFEALTKERHMASSQGTDIVIGGDHSLAVGSATATMERHPGAKLLWIDAHADINTPETSISGNRHGMPVADLLGWMGRPAVTATKDIMYVGIRDVDEKEQEFLDKHGIAAVTSEDMHSDMEGCMCKICDFLGHDKPVHVSLDIDVLSKEHVPGTGTPVEGGLHPEQLNAVLDEVLTRRVPCIDIVEFNPELDVGDKTLQHSLDILDKIVEEKDK
jgi:arginase